jgi:hypothetical protein
MKIRAGYVISAHKPTAKQATTKAPSKAPCMLKLMIHAPRVSTMLTATTVQPEA